MLLLAALALAGCGGSDEPTALPACAQAGPAADLPTSFPESFPLPAGAVLDETRTESGSTIVEGFAPGDLGSVRDFYESELPDSGYELGEGDAEEHEAETEFSRDGVEGRVKLRDIDGCEGAVTISVVVHGE